jgi:hypothetical protein
MDEQATWADLAPAIVTIGADGQAQAVRGAALLRAWGIVFDEPARRPNRAERRRQGRRHHARQA